MNDCEQKKIKNEGKRIKQSHSFASSMLLELLSSPLILFICGIVVLNLLPNRLAKFVNVRPNS